MRFHAAVAETCGDRIARHPALSRSLEFNFNTETHLGHRGGELL
jgi:hypothetical protein